MTRMWCEKETATCIIIIIIKSPVPSQKLSFSH